MKKPVKVAALIFAMLLFTLSAIGENTAWNCPDCGRTNITSRFCGTCGHAAPWLGFVPYLWDCSGCGRLSNSGNYCSMCGHASPWVEAAQPTAIPEPTATPAPLAITSQPTNQTAMVGERVSFTVKVNHPDAEYVWQFTRNSTPYSWAKINSADYSGTIAATLSFTLKEQWKDCSYRCVITLGTQSVVTQYVKVIVQQPTPTPVPTLTITSQQSSKSVSLGDEVKLQVEVNITGAAYEWQYSVKPTSESAWYAIRSSDFTGKNTSTLRFVAKEQYRSLSYRCVVTYSSQKVVSQTFYISFKKDQPTNLSITKQPADVSTRNGTTITLSVGVNQSGAKYEWQYTTRAGNTWKKLTSAQYTGANGSTLRFTASGLTTSRLYRCVITYNGKKATTRTVEVKLSD